MTSLAAIPAFAHLSRATQAALAGHTVGVRYRADAVVRPAGVPVDAALLLLRGTVVAAYRAPGGGQLWPVRWSGPAIVDKPTPLGGPSPSDAMLPPRT